MVEVATIKVWTAVLYIIAAGSNNSGTTMTTIPDIADRKQCQEIIQIHQKSLPRHYTYGGGDNGGYCVGYTKVVAKNAK